MSQSIFEKLQTQTKNMSLIWKETRGIAPDSVADKLDDAMLKWMCELTDTLGIWIEKGTSMTDGELILARINMGSLVECWLKFFYCAYYEDYLNAPHKVSKKGKEIIIEPEKMKFEDLINHSIGILWKDKNDPHCAWAKKIQNYRNAVHAFNYRDIGDAERFIADIDEYYGFVNLILGRLPSIEDMLPYYPAGYDLENDLMRLLI